MIPSKHIPTTIEKLEVVEKVLSMYFASEGIDPRKAHLMSSNDKIELVARLMLSGELDEFFPEREKDS